MQRRDWWARGIGVQCADSAGTEEIIQEDCSKRREAGLGNSGVHPRKTRKKMARVSRENQERVAPQRQWDRAAGREDPRGQTQKSQQEWDRKVSTGFSSVEVIGGLVGW